MKSSEIKKIKSLGKGEAFKLNEVEYVFIKNVDADSIIAGNRETGKQEQINLTFFITKNSKTMTTVNEVSVKETVEAMLVKDLRKEASRLSIVGYSKMKKEDLQLKVIAAKEEEAKTPEQEWKEMIADLRAQKAEAAIERDKATDQDAKNFQSNRIKDINVDLKAAKEELAKVQNLAKVEAEKTNKPKTNKPSKAQIAKDKKAKDKADKKDKANTDKAEAKKDKAAAKKAKGSATEEIDALIAKGGKWENLIKKGNEISAKRGYKTKYTKGTFMSQIKYRETQNAGYMKGLKMKVTDNGIEKIK